MTAEQFANHRKGERMRATPATRAWTGDIQYRDPIVRDETCCQSRRGCRLNNLRVDQLVRLLAFDAVDHGLLCPASEAVEVEDQCSIAIRDVLHGAIAIATPIQSGQRVAGRYRAVLRQPARRAPSAAGKAGCQRRVECSAVDAGLSAGNDSRQGQVAPDNGRTDQDASCARRLTSAFPRRTCADTPSPPPAPAPG